MTPPSTCLLIISLALAASSTTLFCSSPQGPPPDAAIEDTYVDTYTAPPDEGIWDAGGYDGVTGPPCYGSGCGNAACWPTCGPPGKQGSAWPAGGNTQQ